VTACEIITDDPRLPEVRAVLERHLAFCLSETPPEHSFALDVDGLLDPQVTFVSYRDGDVVLGVAAIKELDAADVEVKSMHTTAEARGRGVGRALLRHLLDTARERGYRRVLLETGTTPGFAAARALHPPGRSCQATRARHAGLAEVLTHRDAGLAAADDDDFDLFDAHGFLLRGRVSITLRQPGGICPTVKTYVVHQIF
jgi:putative acetyltransferase